MLSDIKNFFDSFLQPESDKKSEDEEHRLRLATAALLVEVMRADYDVSAVEAAAIKQSLKTFFNLSDQESQNLLSLAEKATQDAACHYEFTSLINKNFDAKTKEKIIELLWRVVFADQQMDKYEEATVRKIADLIHVPHSAFIAAKLRARDS